MRTPSVHQPVSSLSRPAPGFLAQHPWWCWESPLLTHCSAPLSLLRHDSFNQRHYSGGKVKHLAYRQRPRPASHSGTSEPVEPVQERGGCFPRDPAAGVEPAVVVSGSDALVCQPGDLLGEDMPLARVPSLRARPSGSFSRKPAQLLHRAVEYVVVDRHAGVLPEGVVVPVGRQGPNSV